VRLGDLEREGVIVDIQDGNHGEKHPKSSDYVPSGVPFIMAQDLVDGRLDLEHCNFIRSEQARSLRIGFARPGDVLLTHKATMGRVAVVPGNYEYVMLTPQVTYYRTGDRSRLDAGYLRYAFSSPPFQYQLNATSDQSTRKYISISAQRDLWIALPPLPEQRAIARVLGTLDEKIDLNRRMNETLEAMARAIFKSWFVDFDPVRAKAEGRRQPVEIDPAIASLFPNSFEDSRVGQSPRGWQVRPLDRVAQFLNGLALQKYPAGDAESLPVIKIAELRSGSTTGSDRASSRIPNEYVIEDGDLLFSWSGTLEVRVWCGGKGALNQHLFKVMCTEYPKWFVLRWIEEHLPAFQAIAASKATTMGHIQRHHLAEALVLIPPSELLERVDGLLAPLFNLVVANQLETRTLATIRDALLPKLLSGETRVKDAEKLLGAST
jgi:type I restriction enzyme S subunit